MYRHEIESKCLVVYVDHYLDSLFFSFDCTVKCRVACRKQKENVQSSIFTYDKNFLFAFALKTKEVFICNVFLFIRVQQPKKKERKRSTTSLSSSFSFMYVYISRCIIYAISILNEISFSLPSLSSLIFFPSLIYRKKSK